MLVVGRIEVGDIAGELACGSEGIELVSGGLSGPRSPQKFGDPQFEGSKRARGPIFKEGHLHAGGAIDAVGSFEQRGEQDGFEFWVKLRLGDFLSDRIDAGAVFGAEKTRVFREGLRDVAGLPIELIEVLDPASGLALPIASIGLDIAAAEHRREVRMVVGGDAHAGFFKGMADA